MIDDIFSKLMDRGGLSIDERGFAPDPKVFKGMGATNRRDRGRRKIKREPEGSLVLTTICRPSGYPSVGCSSAEPTSVSPNL